MAKLTILAFTLLALLSLSKASTITTTTVTLDEEENPRGQQSCREQIQRQREQLRHCAQYLSSQRRPYDEEPLRMVTNQQQQQQQELRQCCNQLENMDEQCRCEAIRQVLRRQQERGELEGEEMQQVAQRARSLPSRCNLRPQQCQIRVVLF
ncbi:2S sulfur-rich seed storage protein 2-like [Cornus florida]|uniref:2S sulfur-rich seed storage protein 2-like n=1 Tax=Cornus florida TaxID=4283 RepID=UPI00289AD2F1|nr:2S sulfur-rich seed storage protein 2-like [Cornus florida]